MSEKNVQTSRCVACSGPLEHFGRRREYTYMICRTCGSIQLLPMPSKSELDAAYRHEYADAKHIANDPQQSRAATRTLHETLVSALQRQGVRGKVLDYGCGWGGLVIQLREAGFDCIGYDLSEQMVEFCRAEGLPVHLGGIQDVREGPFDAIVLASVFEHLNDPVSWLREARRLLRPSGILVSTQPTAPFARLIGTLARLGVRQVPLPALHQIFCPPWHVALYSLRGMRELAEREGFEEIEVRSAPQQREPGLTGLAQRSLEAINRVGWNISELKWPLFTGHVFVFRSRGE